MGVGPEGEVPRPASSLKLFLFCADRIDFVNDKFDFNPIRVTCDTS